MKRVMILVLLALLLAGCSGAEDPYRVDTVVYIPADPTAAPGEEPTEEETLPIVPTEPETEASEQTAVPTETPETEPKATEPKNDTPAKKPSSGKKGTSGKKDNSDKETEPPETKPAEPKPTEPKPTEPKPTEPKPTEPKPTEPKPTEPKPTEPKPTEPKPTEPKPTEPKPTEPKPTEPKATELPVEKPKETEPPVTEVLAETPKATEPPATEPEPEGPALYDISGYSVGSLEKSMKKAINSYRTEAGLDELSLNSRLSAIASCRSYEISQVWSHTRPDGRSYKTVLSDYGYSAGSVQELLVYVSGSGDGAAIIEKWMNSDSHKELLLGGYSKMGIGIYRAGGYTYITCLLVG